jgi:LDH2 family malate/lactate/ureidoglycolate dehydrogenase
VAGGDGAVSGAGRVLVPDERSFAEMARRRRDGIPLRRPLVEELRRWAADLGVPALDAS